MKEYQIQPVDWTEEPDLDDEPGALKPADISQIVLYSTDWTTETILSQLTHENIDINPRFQRRDAWKLARKSRLIESLILGLPVPEVVLAEKKEERGKYLVLDGKQRLLTLLQFRGFSTQKDKNNRFALTGLEVREDLNGKSFSDLEGKLFSSDLTAFLNSTIRSVVIRNWPNTELLHLVFRRLNTGSVPLSPQELRQALLPGPFADFVDDQASGCVPLHNLMGIAEPDFRMRDVELVVRYFGFAFFLNYYTGNMRAFLDFTCANLNSQWKDKQSEISEAFEQFEAALLTTSDIFGDKATARKWTGTEFESRVNRAVLDVMLFYFSRPKIRAAAKKNKPLVVRAFKNLCTKNADFRSAIETTTKSLTATRNRFNLWGKVLSKGTGVRFKVPDWNADRTRLEID